MVAVKGDLTVVREADRDRGLVGPTTINGSGTVVIPPADIGRTVFVNSDSNRNNTVTLPATAGASRIGDHLDLVNESEVAFRIIPDASDSFLFTEGVTLLEPYARMKCKIVAANVWALSETFEQGGGSSILQQTRIQLTYQASDQQTLPDNLGSTPSTPGTKLDLSGGTVESDNLSAFRSASDDFLIRRTGFFNAELCLTLHNNQGSAVNCYAFLVINGTAIHVDAHSLPISSSGVMSLRWRGVLTTGDVVDFRAGVEGSGENVGLRGFTATLEQLVPLTLDHTYCPAAVFSLAADTAPPAINSPLKLDQYWQTSGAYSAGIKARGNGVFELRQGRWFIEACVHFDYVGSGQWTQWKISDVTAASNPLTDAGTTIGSTTNYTRASNSLGANAGGRSDIKAFIDVPTTPKLIKIEKINTSNPANENEQRVNTSVLIRRVR